MRPVAVAAVAAALLLLLTGCFGPSTDELKALAQTDFDALVDVASGADIAVLHTLEVEEPSAEACDTEHPDAQHTVFVAAGTMAIQTTGVEERDLLTEFEPTFDDPERWTEVDRPGEQRAYVGVEGITASMTIDDGLLVIAVFTPCK